MEWVIAVGGGYGAYLFNGTADEAEEARKHKANLVPYGMNFLKELYAKLSDKVGREYHTANIRSLEEARDVYKIIRDLA